MIKRFLDASKKRKQELEEIEKNKKECKKVHTEVRDFLETTAVTIRSTICMTRKG